MMQINLLPWREKRREQRKKQFYLLLAVALLAGAGTVFAGFSYMNARIDNQTARNVMLQNEIRNFDRQIRRIQGLDRQRQSLVDRIEVIQDLQASRPDAVHLFDQMVVTLPEGTFFRELRREGNRLRFVGRSESNARISALMRRVDASPWLRDSNLQIIETRRDGQIQVRDFRLDARQARPARAPVSDAGGS